MKKVFLASLISISTTLAFADSVSLYSGDSVIWTPTMKIINRDSQETAYGPLCGWNNNPNRERLCKEKVGTDISHGGFSSYTKRVTIYQDNGQPLVKLYPDGVECNFDVTLKDDGSASVGLHDSTPNRCKYETFPPTPTTKKNSLSLMVEGDEIWAPIVKLGDEVVKPELCAANVNPELAEQTKKLCKLWYNTDKSSVEISGSEARDIFIYDRKGGLLLDLPTAQTAGAAQCNYTVTLDENASSDQTYKVVASDSKCKPKS
jgi:hypothetical protein